MKRVKAKRPNTTKTNPFGRQQTQWWLAELDRYDNVIRMADGAHSTAQRAHRAYYLNQRLGLIKPDVRYAVVKCELHALVPDSMGANEEALDTLTKAKI